MNATANNTIGKLARAAQINASAIRFYEKRGLLAPPHRVGGQRRYSPHALDRVLLIRFASEMGFTLAEIAMALGRPAPAVTRHP